VRVQTDLSLSSPGVLPAVAQPPDTQWSQQNTMAASALYERGVIPPTRPRLRKPGWVAKPNADPADNLAANWAARVLGVGTRSTGGGGGGGFTMQQVEVEMEVEEEVIDDPDALPPGWQAVKDDDGDTFFYHAASGESTWDKPPPPSRKVLVKRKVTKTVEVPAGANGAAAGGAAKGGGWGKLRGLAGSGKPASAREVVAVAFKLPPASASTGVSEDPACDNFQANPFRPDMCSVCRKKQDKHAAFAREEDY
jgi:hypothetical protein